MKKTLTIAILGAYLGWLASANGHSLVENPIQIVWFLLIPIIIAAVHGEVKD